jgi:hypothetical protein
MTQAPTLCHAIHSTLSGPLETISTSVSDFYEENPITTIAGSILVSPLIIATTVVLAGITVVVFPMASPLYDFYQLFASRSRTPPKIDRDSDGEITPLFPFVEINPLYTAHISPQHEEMLERSAGCSHSVQIVSGEATMLINRLKTPEALQTCGLFQIEGSSDSPLGFAMRLKRYFLPRTKQAPLIPLMPTHFTYREFLKLDISAQACLEYQNDRSKEALIKDIKPYFEWMEATDVRVQLILLLNAISQHSDVNCMPADHLAFALTPMLTALFDIQEVLKTTTDLSFATFLIENADTIFNAG